MQTTTAAFTTRAKGSMRHIDWRCLMSFDKAFDTNIDFFTIGVSTIGGTDIIKGEGDVVQEWDKYAYDDFTDRIISVEWSRDQNILSSVSLAMADIVLDNHDDYFTPNGGSAIDDFILPYRPIKLYAGFKDESVPVFVGLTEKMPVVDDANKTVSFHCIDFLYSLFNRPLDESLILTEVRTDEILDDLFQIAGLLPSQYNLDVGFNIVKFSYFPKGSKLGDAVSELLEAEMGRLYLDELGVIQFKNRQNFSQVPVYAFSPNNILNVETSKQDDLINVVEVKADVREVQANQKYWELQSPILIRAGEIVEIWADFEDPVTNADDPDYITSAVTSSYTTNVREDGTGSNNSGDITLNATTLFAQSFKMPFENTGTEDIYITTLEVFATPAKIVKQIYLREFDATSVTKYDERVLTIENNFIQREDEAYSKALILLGDYSEYGSTLTLLVKGNPAIQLNDAIDVVLPGAGVRSFIVDKIRCKIQAAKFEQALVVKQRDPTTYFTIGISTIGGSDVIAP